MWARIFDGSPKNSSPDYSRVIQRKSLVLCRSCWLTATFIQVWRLGMSLQSASGLWPVKIEVSKAPLTSDARLLPVRQLDERPWFIEQPTTTPGCP